jgi:putative flavoprotein involved in K+ transport
MSDLPDRVSAVVIGAGPAGLAAAAELQRVGVETIVLDKADRVGSSWAGHYDRLHLHTSRGLSGLPGYRIPRRYGRWSRATACSPTSPSTRRCTTSTCVSA